MRKRRSRRRKNVASIKQNGSAPFLSWPRRERKKGIESHIINWIKFPVLFSVDIIQVLWSKKRRKKEEKKMFGKKNTSNLNDLTI